MRTLSRIECFNVGCTNEASVTINGDHVCTKCASADLPEYLHKFLPVPAPKCVIGDCESPKEPYSDMCAYHYALGAVDRDHWCSKHQHVTGEGDICAACEDEFDKYRMLINLEMSKHMYELWFVLSKQYMYRCPVSNFDEAKMLHMSLSCATGVRIARMSEEEGCESVLHKFN